METSVRSAMLAMFLTVICYVHPQSSLSTTLSLKPFEKGGKWGFVEPNGNVVVEPTYVAVKPFREGYALVMTRGSWSPLGNEYGAFRLAEVTWIDRKGKQIRPPLSVRSASSFSEGLAAVVPDKALRAHSGCAKGGYIGTNGDWAIRPEFDGVTDFSEGLAAVNLGAQCGTGGSWGYIDKNGKTIISFKFASAMPFKNGHACVFINRTGTVIDQEGNVMPGAKCK